MCVSRICFSVLEQKHAAKSEYNLLKLRKFILCRGFHGNFGLTKAWSNQICLEQVQNCDICSLDAVHGDAFDFD